MPDGFTVHTFEDLGDAQLSETGMDRVLRELATGEFDIVLHIRESFAREGKDLESLEGARSLFGVRSVPSETEKAWGVSQSTSDWDEAHREAMVWVPKSVAELYRRDPTHGTRPKTSPQKGLGEF